MPASEVPHAMPICPEVCGAIVSFASSTASRVPPPRAARSGPSRTDYRIDIFAVVSVTDTLYTFYAEGIGKVAEAERQRISAMALFNTDTRVGKVLVAFTPTIKLPPVEPVQAP